MRLVTPEQLRQMDAMTIEQVGIPGLLLMEHAALGAVEALLAAWPLPAGARIGVACGAGNNGGDGLAMARLLARRGLDVLIAMAVEEGKLSGDAAINLRAAQGLGLPIVHPREAHDWDALPACEVWIDALLGTGLDRPVRGHLALAIEHLNRQPRVMAVDVPSGVHAGTGQLMGCAVRAHLTATFGSPKLGLALEPGFAQVGALKIIDIGLPAGVVKAVGSCAELTDRAWLDQALRPRHALMHKGHAGRVLVVTGEPRTLGAGLMAAVASLEAGAGLITVLVEPSLLWRVTLAAPELMAADLEDEPERLGALELADVVIIGPGLGQGERAQRVLQEAITRAKRLVLDADALGLLARMPAWAAWLAAQRAGRATVLTPHPGELERLDPRPDAQAEAPARVQRALALAQDSGAVFVAKGARTITASPSGALYVSPMGNPGMASGGMGDTLTGVIAAQLVEQDDPAFAAAAAVAWHGAAGDLAAARHGERGVTASRVRQALGHALASRPDDGERAR